MVFSDPVNVLDYRIGTRLGPDGTGVQGHLVVRCVAPDPSGVSEVVIRPGGVLLGDACVGILGRDAVALGGTVYPVGNRCRDEDADDIPFVPEDVVRTPFDEDAWAVARELADGLGLLLEQGVGRGEPPKNSLDSVLEFSSILSASFMVNPALVADSSTICLS